MKTKSEIGLLTHAPHEKTGNNWEGNGIHSDLKKISFLIQAVFDHSTKTWLMMKEKVDMGDNLKTYIQKLI